MKQKNTHYITDTKLNPVLFWDFDVSKMDYIKNRDIIVERVLEYGNPTEFHNLFEIYDGYDNVKNIVKNDVRHLDKRTIPFVENYFGLDRKLLQCYIRTQLREKLLNS